MKKRVIFGTALLAVLTLISFFFDEQVLNFITENRASFLDKPFLAITYIGSSISVLFIGTAIFFAGALYYHKRKKQIHKYSTLLLFWITWIISTAIIFILKYFIARPRPPTALMELTSNSFPSGHALIAFSMLPIISKTYPKLKWPWLIFTLFSVLSRLHFNMHYLSDILAGTLIGLAVGFFVLKFCGKKSRVKQIIR